MRHKCPKCGFFSGEDFDEVFKVGDEVRRLKGKSCGEVVVITGMGEKRFFFTRAQGTNNIEQSAAKISDYWEKVPEAEDDDKY